jgi:FMN reductase
VLNVVALSGSPSAPSRTHQVLASALDRIAAATGAETSIVELAELVPDLGIRARTEASVRLEAALKRVETADLLLAGTPVYKGSYPGLFKHFVDLIAYPGLLGVPVGIIATGGSDRHALIVEYQLRPLFAFFGAKTLPTAVFISDKTIAGGVVEEASVSARLDQLIAEVVLELTLMGQKRTIAAG